MRLILFDVDGTLLSCGPQVRPLFAAALAAAYGTCCTVDGYDFAGRTDSKITLDLARLAGLSPSAARRGLEQVRRFYLEQLEQRLERRGMSLMPGVLELLERLARRRELSLGLLTGNWEPGARTKLSRFDLNHFFPFGAFGDDGVERPELLPVALARAAASTGRSFRPEETLLVGDTVHDVACAKVHGARVLAVATGTTPAAALEEAGADWVVADLPAAQRQLSWLAG